MLFSYEIFAWTIWFTLINVRLADPRRMFWMRAWGPFFLQCRPLGPGPVLQVAARPSSRVFLLKSAFSAPWGTASFGASSTCRKVHLWGMDGKQLRLCLERLKQWLLQQGMDLFVLWPAGASTAGLNPASWCAGVTFLVPGCKAALTAGPQPGSQGSPTLGQGLVPVCGLLGTGLHSRRRVVGN